MPFARSVAAALLLLLPLAACTRSEGHADEVVGPGVPFVAGSFDEALARARSENRLVMVDVYTDWCGWCKKLDREVFASGRVADAAKGIVAVRVNAEEGGEDVARRYGVSGYPTILFVDGAGKLVRRVEGYVDVSEMVRILSSLPGR